MFEGAIKAEGAIELRRRALRLGIEVEVGLRELGQTGAGARILNISSLGFMAEAAAEIAAGSRVWLTLPGIGRVNGLVIWSRGGRIGGEFAEPLDPLAMFQAIGERAEP